MIDKSIRQYYENGKEVGPVTKGMKMIWDPIKQKYLPGGKLDIGQVAKTALTRKLTGAATKKLAGTGILSSLGPIGMLIAYMLAKKGMRYASGKMPDIQTSLQAFQTGFGSPEEQRELRQLEKRRANMLQRKNEGRNYSEKNLDIVTRAIAEAKGLDINNPNEMRNIDKPITQIRTERSITEPPRIIPETPEVKSPFAKPIPKTPEVIIPHLEGDRTIPTPTTVTRDMGLGDAGIAERIAAENRAAATQAAAIKAEMDRQQRERDAAAARAPISVPVPAHISGGQNGGQRGSPPTGTAGRNPWGRAYGGRIDKALGGRSRDIG